LDSPVRLPGDQPVLLDGTINLGSFGHYVAAGKTVDVIESEVRGLISAKAGNDPGFVTVRLVTSVSNVFYVLGEVNTPGSFARKKNCGPCTGPEIPCVFGANGCGGIPGPFALTPTSYSAPVLNPPPAPPEPLPPPKVEGK